MTMQPFELPDFYVPWPARINPNLEAARAHSKTWAREMGILDAPQDGDSHNIWDEHDFDKHDYALLCAYIHPEAPTPELNLMADWNVWAFYVDDYFLQVYKRPKDHDGAKKYLDRVLLFMPVDLSPLPAPTNPMERGLADLWLRTAPTKSEAWRGRIIDDTRNLLEAFLWELDSMSQQRLANPIEYIEMRRQVGAALWSADLVEHAMFVEIPERIAATRPMCVLKDTFADAVHLRNDIFSYQREVLKEGELTNAILVIERFLNVDTQRAANLTNDLLTSRLQQFEHTVLTELAPMFQEYALEPLEQASVLNYIRGLQDWQSGAHEWHIQTSRYLNPHPHDGQAFTIGGFFLPGLTGLGTTAARITPGTLGLNRFKNYKHVPYEKVEATQFPEFYMPFKTSANPHLERVRQNSKLWARQMGMLDTLPGHPSLFVWDDRRFDAADVSFFCALAYPKATAAQLDLAARWLVWATYTDDYGAEVYGHTHDLAGAKICQARLSEFMPIENSSLESVALTPVERGLADLWKPTTETLDIEARLLFHKTILDMIGTWQWELSNRIQNRIPELIDYIEMRRKTSGIDFMLVFIRSVYGHGILPEVHRTRAMQELQKTAGDHVFLTNDLVSYQKEIEFEGDMHNGVLVIQNFLDCDHIHAVEIVNNLMTARVNQFERIAMTELPLLFENFNLDAKAREQLLNHVEELQYFMCASLHWHTKVDRYKEFELRRSALPRPFMGNPTGLGTAAARALTIIGGGEVQPAPSFSPQAEEALPEAPNMVKTFAISHLAPSFIKKKEEAQLE
jgi:germacradienol/geosmin synthase